MQLLHSHRWVARPQIASSTADQFPTPSSTITAPLRHQHNHQQHSIGCVASFRRRQIIACAHVCSGCQIEEMVDEFDLSRQIISCHPSNLPLPDHVDCFVALNGSPGRLEFSESLLGIHSTFDGSMILFEDVIQVLHGACRQRSRSVPSFLLSAIAEL
jgi:hypothetical protein